MTTIPENDKLLKQALEWFFLLQLAQCNAQNKLAFDCWCHASEANQAAYSEAERLWSQLDQLKTVAELPEVKKVRRIRRKDQTSRPLGVAVLFLVASAMIAAGWQEYHTEVQVYTTQLGERRNVTLNDGGTVKLNTDCTERAGWNAVWANPAGWFSQCRHQTATVKIILLRTATIRFLRHLPNFTGCDRCA